MKRIQLTQGKFTLVDNEDFKRVNQYKWYAHRPSGHPHFYRYTYYACTTINKKKIRMHRFIMNVLANPKIPIDHINHNGLDNRKSNLRLTTHSMNRRNIAPGMERGKGYTFHKIGRKWQAQIQINKKVHFLGLFDTANEARKVYLQAKNKVEENKSQ